MDCILFFPTSEHPQRPRVENQLSSKDFIGNSKVVCRNSSLGYQQRDFTDAIICEWI